MKSKLFFISVALLCFNCFLPAQNPFIRHYTTFDGLPCNIVYYVYQDSQKFIWFATDAGAVKFDGSKFIIFTKKEGLNSNNIRSIKEDSSGRLWIINRNGSLNFFYKNKVFNASNAPFLDSLKPVEAFSDFFEDDDHTIYFYNLIWEAVALDRNNKVRKFEKVHDALLKKFTWDETVNLYKLRKNLNGEYLAWSRQSIFKFKKLFEDPVLIYHQDDLFRRASASRDRYFYIVARGSWIYKYKDENLLDSIPIPITIDYGASSNNYILLDNERFFWYRTWNKGVYCFRDNRVVRHLDIKQASMIIQDHENNIWISSIKDGVYKISPNQTSYQHFENDHFRNRGVRNITADPGGGIWLTNGQSVYFFKNDKFCKMDFDKPNGSFDVIYHFKKDQLIIGERGSDFFTIRGLKPNTVTNKIEYRRIISSKESVSSIGGISYNRKEDKMNSFHYFSFFCLDPDRLFIYDQPEHNVGSAIYLTYYDNKDDLIINAGKNYILKDDTAIYAKELSCFDNKIITQHLNLSDTVELFVIGYEDLYLYCRNKFYKLSSSPEGADNFDIRYVTYDAPVLYISNFRNIYRCRDPLDAISGKPVHLQFEDITFRNIYHILASNDTLYVGSDDGLTVIPEKNFGRSVSDPPVPYFHSILVNDKETDFSGMNLYLKGRNNLKFIFSSINYSSSPVIYSYKLDGADPDWSFGTGNIVAYQNLPFGNYIFKLRTCKPNSIWSKTLEIKIHIIPRFWQHPVFFVFIIVLLLVLIFLVFLRITRNKLKRRETDHQLILFEQKALQSMMNPHFIFNTLGSIQNFLLQNKSDEAGLYLSQFARLIRLNISSINSALITLEEEVNRLRIYLDLEQFRMENKFEYSIEFGQGIEEDEVYIPSMLIQPFVENSIWHGISPLEVKGLIRITFSIHSSKAFQIIVEDNGVGIRKSEKYSSKGVDHLHLTMNVIRKRLEILGKKMKVKTSMDISEAFPDDLNPGTRIVLIVPFSRNEKEI